MTKQEAVEALKKCHTEDRMTDHIVADKILVNVLYGIGEDEVADEYLKVRKWYA